MARYVEASLYGHGLLSFFMGHSWDYSTPEGKALELVGNDGEVTISVFLAGMQSGTTDVLIIKEAIDSPIEILLHKEVDRLEVNKVVNDTILPEVN